MAGGKGDKPTNATRSTVVANPVVINYQPYYQKTDNVVARGGGGVDGREKLRSSFRIQLGQLWLQGYIVYNFFFNIYLRSVTAFKLSQFCFCFRNLVGVLN
ncbi:hypothetical protein L1987_82938 [Smallanthus sonchifolius]|uniref:Uncharacterized protein n=1 Tax=Smallanthus sonchifolius TaxID=185202 RepID=A0ACB8YC83_9ASTR|nr:hypothetical protein L1987_82938 [Smallanthus sonchifolius]